MALDELDYSLVTTGAPIDGGNAWVCFGSEYTLPTDASSKMSAQSGYESLGEMSEEGITESESLSTTNHKGYHNVTVLTTIDNDEMSFKVSFLEINRGSVAKLKYGSDAVTLDTDGTVKSINRSTRRLEQVTLVFDELESDGHVRRIIIPRAAITSIDDVAYQNGSLMVYGMTFAINQPKSGANYIVYRYKPAEA